MGAAVLELLAFLAELLFWRHVGPRPEPPREDMRVLGDIAPRAPR